MLRPGLRPTPGVGRLSVQPLPRPGMCATRRRVSAFAPVALAHPRGRRVSGPPASLSTPAPLVTPMASAHPPRPLVAAALGRQRRGPGEASSSRAGPTQPGRGSLTGAAAAAGTRSSGDAGDTTGAPPPSFAARLLKPLRDFGFGASSFWEGGVGLFVIAGASFILVLITWARGGRLGRGGRPYRCVLRFPLACGIGVGTPVRVRGVPVGSVVGVEASLDAVSVLAEIRDAGTVIPRSARIEANQSGLIAEPLIDITPTAPAPPSVADGSAASPLDTAACEAEGEVVCHGGVIAGIQGVALDDLVLIMTRMARKLDAADGVDRLLDATEAATAALEDARPLLARAGALAEQALPILTDLRAGGVGSQVADLVAAAVGAAADIRALQGEVLTPGNVRALRDAVGALARTLEHVEGIAGDVGGLTGDARVRGNLKQLIEALSRIVAD